jgi:hypothetical protein
MKNHQPYMQPENATEITVVLRNGHYLFNYKMGRVSGVQMQLSIFENKFSFHVFDLFCFWETMRTACFPSFKVFTIPSSSVTDNFDVPSTMSETTPLCLGQEDIGHFKEISSQSSTKFQKSSRTWKTLSSNAHDQLNKAVNKQAYDIEACTWMGVQINYGI